MSWPSVSAGALAGPGARSLSVFVGLPIGMQIIGRRFADDTVLAASAAFERVRPWQQTYPPRPTGAAPA